MYTWSMRDELRKTYDSYNWRDKVDKMSDAQVFAIYTRFKASGKIK
jgi:hypothetical protein